MCHFFKDRIAFDTAPRDLVTVYLLYSKAIITPLHSTCSAYRMSPRSHPWRGRLSVRARSGQPVYSKIDVAFKALFLWRVPQNYSVSALQFPGRASSAPRNYIAQSAHSRLCPQVHFSRFALRPHSALASVRFSSGPGQYRTSFILVSFTKRGCRSRDTISASVQ